MEFCNFGIWYYGLQTRLDDGINGLPDDLLVSILSRLPLKDAARTCTLSKRWKLLWTQTTGSLDFLYPKGEEVDKAKHDNFINWINHVVGSHQGPTLDEFRISYNFYDRHRTTVHSWLEFALRKRVKRLQFHNSGNLRYSLTTQILFSCSIESLTTLDLYGVHVTEDALQYIFSNSPSLETLSLETANSLVNLRVTGPSLKLKNLKITYCHRMKYIELFALNLVSFTYHGAAPVNFSFCAPFLVDASLGGEILLYLEDKTFRDSCISQLDRLSLNFCAMVSMYMLVIRFSF